MTTTMEAAMAALTPGLPSAAWDLKSFLTNAQVYIRDAGGLLLILLGTAALIWGGVKLVQKLMSGPQGGQQISWGTIILLILIGGALMTGGIALMTTVGSGGQQTITQLGGGATLLFPTLSL